jgi:L-ascorbate metabolism protein UlaG (beta-lactamase superfamily)
VLVDTGSTRLLFDPGCYSDFDDVRDLDAILITHRHNDHLDPERLPALVKNNPNATLYVDTASAEHEIAELSLDATKVRPGDALDIGGTAVNVVGGEHALIHPEHAMPPNVCYVVDHGAFYQPGDSLFLPEQKIDVLGLPVAASWLKLVEAAEFVRAVAPRVVVPIHETNFSEPGRNATFWWLDELAPRGTEFRPLTRREPAEL